MDPPFEELLRARFTLLGKNDERSGRHFLQTRDDIKIRYLVPVGQLSTVILRSNRNNFEQAVNGLKEEVKQFQSDAKKKQAAVIQRNSSQLPERLLPHVRIRLARKRLATLGPNPSDKALRERLGDELREAYNIAVDCINDITVNVIYKDVSGEMLSNPYFREAAKRAKLRLEEHYEEPKL